MKKIILCADDFGLNPSISQGIINLISKQRLSATSCMCNINSWDQLLPKLLEHHDHLNIGLHFNLTEGHWLSTREQAPSLATLILKSYTRLLQQKQIENELMAQFQAFKLSTGFLPDYIDGHQHIQQLPIIRDAIVAVIKKLYPTQKPYLRISSNGLFQRSFKEMALHLLGANQLKHLAVQAAIPMNPSFAGIYNLKASADYAKLFEGWLQRITNHGIIMCHPGLQALVDSNDPICKARFNEYEFFASPLFLDLLQKHCVEISSFVLT